MAKIIFCNADANDDADTEMPMPRFSNSLDKNTFWLLLPNNWIELKLLHAEALKNLISRSNSLDYSHRLQYKLKRKKWRSKVSALVFFIVRQKLYIVNKLFNKNRCEKIDAHVLSFVFPTKTLLSKKLLNIVKHAPSTERFANW